MVERRFKTEHSAVARCSKDTIMDELLDATKWPSWQPEIVSASGPTRMSEGDVARGRARMLGFGVHGVSVAAEVGPRVFEEDVVVGVAMRVRYLVEDLADGCRVTHSLVCEVPSGPAGRILGFFLRLRLRRMQRTAVARLVAQSEAADRS